MAKWMYMNKSGSWLCTLVCVCVCFCVRFLLQTSDWHLPGWKQGGTHWKVQEVFTSIILGIQIVFFFRSTIFLMKAHHHSTDKHTHILYPCEQSESCSDMLSHNLAYHWPYFSIGFKPFSETFNHPQNSFLFQHLFVFSVHAVSVKSGLHCSVRGSWGSWICVIPHALTVKTHKETGCKLCWPPQVCRCEST